MPHWTRRDFLKASLAGAGLAAAAPGLLRAAEGPQKFFKGNDLVPLGRTGITVSRVCQGTGTGGWEHASDQTRLGHKEFDRLLHHGWDQGLRFVDMADLYGSHEYVKSALQGRQRDKLVLLTKLWTSEKIQKWAKPTGSAKKEAERYLKEIGVDYLDVCLLHCMTSDKWPAEFRRHRDELSALKSQGKIRALGVSCHSLGALKAAASHPWVDVIFARINYKGGAQYECDGTREIVADVLRSARRNGKGVVAIKVFGRGKLAEPEQRLSSLRYVLPSGAVDAMSLGMVSREHVDDSLKRIGQVPRVAGGVSSKPEA